MTHRQAVAYAFLLVIGPALKFPDPRESMWYTARRATILTPGIARAAYFRLCNQAEGKPTLGTEFVTNDDFHSAGIGWSISDDPQ